VPGRVRHRACDLRGGNPLPSQAEGIRPLVYPYPEYRYDPARDFDHQLQEVSLESVDLRRFFGENQREAEVIRQDIVAKVIDTYKDFVRGNQEKAFLLERLQKLVRFPLAGFWLEAPSHQRGRFLGQLIGLTYDLDEDRAYELAWLCDRHEAITSPDLDPLAEMPALTGADCEEEHMAADEARRIVYQHTAQALEVRLTYVDSSVTEENMFAKAKRLLRETDAKVWLRWEGLQVLDLEETSQRLFDIAEAKIRAQMAR